MTLSATWWQVNALRRAYQERHGLRYDVGIRVRPDVYRAESPDNWTWPLLSRAPSVRDAIFSCRDFRWPGMKGGDMCYFALWLPALDRLYDTWQAVAERDLSAMACAWELRSRSCQRSVKCKASVHQCHAFGEVDPGQGFAENLLASALSRSGLRGLSLSIISADANPLRPYHFCVDRATTNSHEIAARCVSKKYTPCPIVDVTERHCHAQCAAAKSAGHGCRAIHYQDRRCYLLSGAKCASPSQQIDSAHLMTDGNMLDHLARHGRHKSLPLLALSHRMNASYDGVRNGIGGWWLRLASACDGAPELCTLWTVEHALLPAPRCPLNCRLAPRLTPSTLRSSDALLTSQLDKYMWDKLSLRDSRLAVYCLESEAGDWRLQHCPSTTRAISTRPHTFMRFSFFSRYYLPTPLSGTNAAGLLSRDYLKRTQFQLKTLQNGTPIISTWFRHCHTAPGMMHRKLFLAQLRQAGLEYAAYGKCGRTVPLRDPVLSSSEQNWLENKMLGMQKHPFVLVSENAAEPGWVTEKVYQGLAAGVVPVWFGTPAGWAKQHLLPIVPLESVVDASNWATLKELAEFLHMASRTQRVYQRFHRWRHDPRMFNASVVVLKQQLAMAFESAPCRICMELHQAGRKQVN